MNEDLDFPVDHRPMTVVVDGKHIPVDEVHFLDIAEDFLGHDVMTFIYNGKQYTSNVFRS